MMSEENMVSLSPLQQHPGDDENKPVLILCPPFSPQDHNIEFPSSLTAAAVTPR